MYKVFLDARDREFSSREVYSLYEKLRAVSEARGLILERSLRFSSDKRIMFVVKEAMRSLMLVNSYLDGIAAARVERDGYKENRKSS